MKNWNRILAALLSALMLCAMLPTGVLAEMDVVLEGEDLEIVLADAATGEDALELDEPGELDGLDLNGLTLDDLNATDAAAEDAVNAPESNDSNPEDFRIENGRLVEYVGPGGNVVIPDGVVSIADWVFSGKDYILNIAIPSSVASIGVGTFANCTGLKTIAVANDNPYFTSQYGVLFDKGMSTLICCPGSVTGYTIPDGVEYIKGYAFDGCEYLANINITEGVITIGEGAFRNCDSLKNVVIPDSVTSIELGAFYDCDGLTRVDIPYSVKRINDYTFYSCDSLTSMNGWGDVNIPSSVTYIGDRAFQYCASMGSVTIPRSVKKIGYEAFDSCTSLAYVCIPSSVTSVGGYALWGCSALKNITIFARSITFGNTSIFEYGSDDLILYSWANCSTYNWLKNHGYPVQAMPDYFLLVSGNTTKKVQVGDTAWIALDGPKHKSYTSSNKKVATVASTGQLTLKKPGTAKITCNTTSGGKWVLTLNVVAAPKLSKSTLSLKAGRSIKLKVNGLLAGRTVAWSSSNNSIATVSNGKITAKKPGKCTIYAQVKNGVKLKCTVKVTR